MARQQASRPLQNKQCSRQVERSVAHKFLCYWRVRRLTKIKRYVVFITCQWKLKYRVECLYESLFTIIDTFVEITIQHPSWEVMIVHERLCKRPDQHFNLSYTSCTELVMWDGMLHCTKPSPEPMTSFPTGLLQTFSEIWENLLFKQLHNFKQIHFFFNV